MQCLSRVGVILRRRKGKGSLLLIRSRIRSVLGWISLVRFKTIQMQITPCLFHSMQLITWTRWWIQITWETASHRASAASATSEDLVLDMIQVIKMRISLGPSSRMSKPIMWENSSLEGIHQVNINNRLHPKETTTGHLCTNQWVTAQISSTPTPFRW